MRWAAPEPSAADVRLERLRIPAEFRARFERPRQSVAGTRRLAGVNEGPLMGTIIKPNVGLSADETGALVGELCEAGVDFIKDDECCGSPAHAPTPDRIRAVMQRVRQWQDRSGKRRRAQEGSVKKLHRSHSFSGQRPDRGQDPRSPDRPVLPRV